MRLNLYQGGTVDHSASFFFYRQTPAKITNRIGLADLNACPAGHSLRQWSPNCPPGQKTTKRGTFFLPSSV
ncbi:MAG: hypothetical protein R2787_13830 [Saprospiraceae bacterium]